MFYTNGWCAARAGFGQKELRRAAGWGKRGAWFFGAQMDGGAGSNARGCVWPNANGRDACYGPGDSGNSRRTCHGNSGVVIPQGMETTLSTSRGGLAVLGAVLLAGCVAESRNTAGVAFGAGKFDVDIHNSASDEASAGLFEAAFESVAPSNFGGGVRLRGMTSADDLDDDPSDLTEGSVQASDGEWFFHGTLDGGEGMQRLPIRFGLALRQFELEDKLASGTAEWASLGPRFEFAPEVPMSEWDSGSISLCGMFGLGYGRTKVRLTGAPDDWDTDAVFFDIGAGFRSNLNGMVLELGYRYLGSEYDQAYVSSGDFVRETDVSFSGVVFAIGGRF